MTGRSPYSRMLRDGRTTASACLALTGKPLPGSSAPIRLFDPDFTNHVFNLRVSEQMLAGTGP